MSFTSSIVIITERRPDEALLHFSAIMSANNVLPLSVAPMMQWTDRHWRYLMRQYTQKTLLYTEMIMDNALIFNHPHRLESFLGHSDIEHP